MLGPSRRQVSSSSRLVPVTASFGLQTILAPPQLMTSLASVRIGTMPLGRVIVRGRRRVVSHQTETWIIG